MSSIQKISRRNFIYSLGLVSSGLIIGCNLTTLGKTEFQLNPFNGKTFNPNLFIQLKDNGELILVASRSEMGNGVRTSLTSILADEMDADWEYVKVTQATGDAKFLDQNTDGSRSIRTLFEPMRKMGATAKAMLISAAANKWNVNTTDLYTENHFVINKSTNKKLFFGDLVEEATKVEVPKNPKLKAYKDFKYIGKELKSVDGMDFVFGKAKFGMDIKLEGMKYAAIARCPVTFGTVKSFDKTAALKIPGVIDVIQIDKVNRPFGILGGIAVVANNTWAAFKGKEALTIEWDFGNNNSYSSEIYDKQITLNVENKVKKISEKGTIKMAFKNAKHVVKSTFNMPHLVHAPMEVPNATAWVKEDGTCEVWTPSQTPQSARKETAAFLKIDLDKITINVTFLGGGFGRKSKPDYVVEAVAISKEIKAPVQLVWTREDDIQHSYYHAVSAQHLEASLDEKGKVTGWLHRVAYPSIMSTFTPDSGYANPFEFGQGLTNNSLEIENERFENGKANAHIRIGWLRSVINIIQGFSVNVFVDELAVKANKDALQFRLDLIGKDRIIENKRAGLNFDSAKLKNVLSTVAKNANYGKKLPKGHGIGLAMHYSFFSYVASAIEVSVIDGELKVIQVHSVIDCGTAVNKNTIRAQMEGAAIFGMSLTYYGKITAKNGAIEQSNFNDYQVLRMHEAPKINIEIINSEEKPAGVGEPGVPVIAPAIINAIYNATGKRYHSLPLMDFDLV